MDAPLTTTVVLPDGRRFNTHHHQIMVENVAFMINGEIMNDAEHITVFIDGALVAIMARHQQSPMTSDGVVLCTLKACKRPLCHCRQAGQIYHRLMQSMGTNIDPHAYIPEDWTYESDGRNN